MRRGSPDRDASADRGGTPAEFHKGGSKTRRLASSAKSDNPPARNAAGCPASNPTTRSVSPTEAGWEFTAGNYGCASRAAHLQRHGAVDQRRLPARDLRMCLKRWCRPISPKAVLHASWTIGAPRIQAATSSTRAAADPRWRFRWWWMRCGSGPEAQTKRSCRTLSLCSKGVMHYHSLIAQTAQIEILRNEARSLAQLQGAPAAHQ